MGIKRFLIILSLFVFFVCSSSEAGIIGDVNGDGQVNIAEAIYALQISSGANPDIPPGCLITGLDVWSDSTDYNLCDVVNHSGAYYISKTTHTATATSPDADSTNWAIMALQGDTGVNENHSLNAADGGPVDAVFVDNVGNVGIGTTNPQTTLDVKGTMRLAENTSEPFPCDATYGGAIALTSKYTMCVCTGTDWVLTSDGITSCKWEILTDVTAPTVTLTDPENGALVVALNKKVSATFSEPMDPATLTAATFTLKITAGLVPVPGTVTLVGPVATFTPTAPLTAFTTYTATITAGAKDLAGNALVVPAVGLLPNSWTFTTGLAPDVTAPTVTLTDPVNAAINVVTNKKVQATFSESMDPATLTNLTFTLKQGVTVIPGAVSYIGLVATFTPTSALTAGLVYTAEVTTGAKDLAGNALVVPAVGVPANPWTFTTAAVVPLGPLPVNLGTAADFAILTKSGISNVPPSLVTGDIGVSPIGFTAITGFTLVPNDASEAFSTALPDVVGNVYAANYQVPTPAKMTAAISDMETAYTDAAGRVGPTATELGAGNLTGLNLAPGLYKWSTGVSVNAAGTVTLTGGPTDVWIMQVAGDLTMNPGSSVTLAGGALAKNVFWQIGGGTGVLLGTAVAFQGNILAQKTITMNALATVVQGRLLSQKYVTMISNTVTKP